MAIVDADRTRLHTYNLDIVGVYRVMGNEAVPPPALPVSAKSDWLAFGATTATALIGYVFTLAPQVTLGFSGIFATAAMHGGVPHPPGYPLAVLWQQAFVVLLPVSNIAWRVAMSSAVAGALACGLIAAMISRWGCMGLSLDPKRSLRARVVCGWAGGMIFAFNGAFWGRAVIADVWPLTILLFTMIILLIQRWSFAPHRKLLLYAACFSYGLTLTHSQMMLAAVPALPALIAVGNRELARDVLLVGCVGFVGGLVEGCTDVLGVVPDWKHGSLLSLHFWVGLFIVLATARLVAKTRRVLTEWKGVFGCAVAFMLGLLPYLYVPVASITNPPMNWGYARTTDGFFHLVSRGQYERVIPTSDVKTFAKQVSIYAQSAAMDFGCVYLPFACLPWFAYRRLSQRQRRWMLASLPLFACLTLLMTAALNPPLHSDGIRAIKVFFSASYVVLAVWVGCGMMLIAQNVRASRQSGLTSAVTLPSDNP